MKLKSDKVIFWRFCIRFFNQYGSVRRNNPGQDAWLPVWTGDRRCSWSWNGINKGVGGE